MLNEMRMNMSELLLAVSLMSHEVSDVSLNMQAALSWQTNRGQLEGIRYFKLYVLILFVL
jgi:hypothetical protein